MGRTGAAPSSTRTPSSAAPTTLGNAVIREDKQYMRALFVRLVGEAGIPDPAAVGAHAHLLYEGAIVARGPRGGQEGAYDEARAAMTRLLAP